MGGRGQAPAPGRSPSCGEVIKRIGPCRLAPRADRFGTLVRSIVGQQISSKAAASINQRLRALGGQPHHPARLIELGEAALRSVGLSAGKARYVLNLAEAVVERLRPARRHRRFVGRRRDRRRAHLGQGHRRLDRRDVPDLLAQPARRPPRPRPGRPCRPARPPRPVRAAPAQGMPRPGRALAAVSHGRQLVYLEGYARAPSSARGRPMLADVD